MSVAEDVQAQLHDDETEKFLRIFLIRPLLCLLLLILFTQKKKRKCCLKLRK